MAHREDAMRAGCRARRLVLLALPSLASANPGQGTGARAAQRPVRDRARRRARRQLHAAGGAARRARADAGSGARRRLDRAGCARPARGHHAERDARARGLRDRREADRALSATGRSAETCGVAVDAQHGGGPVRVHRRPHAEPADDRPCVCHDRDVRRSADHSGLAQLLLPGADVRPDRVLRNRVRAVRHRRPDRHVQCQRFLHLGRAGRERDGHERLGLQALGVRLPGRSGLRMVGPGRDRRAARLDQRRLRGARDRARARAQPRHLARRRALVHGLRGRGADGRRRARSTGRTTSCRSTPIRSTRWATGPCCAR